jgi:stage III sporulation protein AH
MVVYKKKQIVILSLVLMIIVAGYLQYTYKKSSSSSVDKDNGRLGEAVYVDGKSLEEELELAKKDKKDDKKKDKKDDKETVVEIEASQQANDFFYQAVRVERY